MKIISFSKRILSKYIDWLKIDVFLFIFNTLEDHIFEYLFEIFESTKNNPMAIGDTIFETGFIIFCNLVGRYIYKKNRRHICI